MKKDNKIVFLTKNMKLYAKIGFFCILVMSCIKYYVNSELTIYADTISAIIILLYGILCIVRTFTYINEKRK